MELIHGVKVNGRMFYMIRYLLFIILIGGSITNCSALDMFKASPKPKNLCALVIDYKNVRINPQLLDDPLKGSLELAIFFVKKNYLIKSNNDSSLQNLAAEEELLNYEILSYYAYDVIPKQIITDKVEIAKNATYMIIFLRQNKTIISRAEMNISPKETKAMNIALIETKIKVTKNK